VPWAGKGPKTSRRKSHPSNNAKKSWNRSAQKKRKQLTKNDRGEGEKQGGGVRIPSSSPGLGGGPEHLHPRDQT